MLKYAELNLIEETLVSKMAFSETSDDNRVRVIYGEWRDSLENSVEAPIEKFGRLAESISFYLWMDPEYKGSVEFTHERERKDGESWREYEDLAFHSTLLERILIEAAGMVDDWKITAHLIHYFETGESCLNYRFTGRYRRHAALEDQLSNEWEEA